MNTDDEKKSLTESIIINIIKGKALEVGQSKTIRKT